MISHHTALIYTMVLTSAAALLTACGSLIGYSLVTARSQLTRELQNMADVVGANSGIALASMDPESARKTLSALSADDRVQGGLLIDADGNLLAEYRRSGTALVSFEQYLAPGLHRESGVIIVSRPVQVRGEVVGTMAWNGHRHFESWYGIMGVGAVEYGK